MPSPKKHPNWTRDEHILAFNLYCKILFGRIHTGNPRLIELSKLLNRSVGSISLKLANFARLDPSLQARDIAGMSHGAKGEEEVWEEFAKDPEALAYESECLLAERLGKTVEAVAEIEPTDASLVGKEREAIVKMRVNQSYFRRRILSAYQFKCCITGISAPELLVASHIIPWCEDIPNRLNPRNGLCLNGLHDRAFDRHLMWIDPDFKIRYSPKLLKTRNSGDTSLNWLLGFEGAPLVLPDKFSPDLELLRKHAKQARQEHVTN